MAAVCTCDPTERQAAGTKVLDGVERCKNCGRPLEEVRAQHKAWTENRPAPVGQAFVSTLPNLDGHVVIETLGLVTAISSSKIRGAQEKGSRSMDAAMDELRANAGDLGANAILGVSASPFAASIGGVMGDAVGTLVIGTAVVVEPR